METDRILCGDALEMLRTLPDNSVHCCITSPPYYALRDYGAEGQIGREDTPAQYVARLTDVFLSIYQLNACALVTDIESNSISSTELIAEDKGIW